MVPSFGDHGLCRDRLAPADHHRKNCIRIRVKWVMVMGSKRVLVIGGNFGGLTAALESSMSSAMTSR